MQRAYVLQRNLARFLVRGGAGWSWRAAKNVAKLALGRPTWFAPTDIFFGLYIGQLLGGPRVRLTCDLAEYAGREGAGSQAMMIMSALAFARALGLEYVHTPFAALDHVEGDPARWVARWEAHFNLGAGKRPASAASSAVNFGPATFVRLVELFAEAHPANAEDGAIIPLFPPEVLAELRRKYRANKPARPSDTLLTVGVHLRRLTAYDPVHPYAMPVERMARTLAKVETVLARAGLAYRVRVVSQGPAEDFAALTRPGTELLLDGDPIAGMQALIDADILLTSRGSFSYVAALLCEGIVICDAFYPPQAGWIVGDGADGFDGAALEAKLEMRRRAGAS